MIAAHDMATLMALRLELGRCRQETDGTLGRALQLLNRLEAEWRERQRDERLTNAERASLGAEQ